MTSDPYAGTPGDPYDPDGTLKHARAALVDAIGDKLKGQIVGVPGPDPAVIEVRQTESDGTDVAVTLTIPLGVTREAVGHLVAASVEVLRSVPRLLVTDADHAAALAESAADAR